MDITISDAQQQVDDWIKRWGALFSELTNLGIFNGRSGRTIQVNGAYIR